jgi:hypothetical protein
MRSALLVELLGEYTDHGDEKSFDCPFCERTGRSPDREQKLWVNETKSMFICYRCETKGPLSYMFNLLGAEQDQVVPKTTELAKRIRRLNGDQVEPDFVAEDDDQNGDIVDYFVEIVSNGCTPISVGSVAWNYLVDRNVDDQLIDFYHIIDGRGRYRNRVIVPTFNTDGTLAYFVARAYRPIKMKAKDGTLKDAPKYLNPKGHGRKHSVFNLSNAVAFDTIIITEGVFSAIAAGKNAVATYGKLVTDTQVELIANAAAGREVIVCLDGDAHEQTVEVAGRLQARNVHTSIAVLPLEHDPDSIGPTAFAEVIAARLPFSKLSVAKLQATGQLRRTKPQKAYVRTVDPLDKIRKILSK